MNAKDTLSIKEAVNIIGKAIYPRKWGESRVLEFLKLVDSSDLYSFNAAQYLRHDNIDNEDDEYWIYRKTLNSIVASVRSGGLQLFTYEETFPIYFTSEISTPINTHYFHTIFFNGAVIDNQYSNLGIKKGSTVYVFQDQLNTFLGQEENKTKGAGGRPPTYNWPDIAYMLLSKASEEDLIFIKADGTINQTAFITKIKELYVATHPNASPPSDTAIKESELISRVKHWYSVRHNVPHK